MKVYLETERLILRHLTLDDVDNLYELDADPDVMRFLNGGQPTPYETIRTQTLPRLVSYAQDERYGCCAAIEKASSAFVGWCMLRPVPDAADSAEVGYRLRRSVWGQGYAPEATRALIHKSFTELNLQRIVAYTLADNTKSRRVMEKAGLTFVRTFIYDAPGQWHDKLTAVEYALDNPARLHS